MEERIRARIGTVLNDNGVDILSEDGGSLLHGLYRVIEQELDKAREEGKEDVLKQLEKLAHYGAEHFKNDEHSQFLNLCNGIYYFKRWGKLSKLKTKEDEK